MQPQDWSLVVFSQDGVIYLHSTQPVQCQIAVDVYLNKVDYISC